MWSCALVASARACLRVPTCVNPAPAPPCPSLTLLPTLPAPLHHSYGHHMTREQVSKLLGSDANTNTVVEFLRDGGVADAYVALSAFRPT